jgi:hypothetical protein
LVELPSLRADGRLFQTEFLHLLHQILMVKLNNNLKGIVRPR